MLQSQHLQSQHGYLGSKNVFGKGLVAHIAISLHDWPECDERVTFEGKSVSMAAKNRLEEIRLGRRTSDLLRETRVHQPLRVGKKELSELSVLRDRRPAFV